MGSRQLPHVTHARSPFAFYIRVLVNFNVYKKVTIRQIVTFCDPDSNYHQSVFIYLSIVRPVTNNTYSKGQVMMNCHVKGTFKCLINETYKCIVTYPSTKTQNSNQKTYLNSDCKKVTKFRRKSVRWKQNVIKTYQSLRTHTHTHTHTYMSGMGT
jgi:hypothetical protein